MADRATPEPQIVLTTTLDAPIDAVWQALLRPATLAFISRGWLRSSPVDPARLPERWTQGDYLVKLTAHRILPLGWQVLGISFPQVASPRRVLRDRGRGRLLRLWDHRITLTPEGDRTRYTDQVRIEAGWLTPLIVFWARGFYAHRQRRWHRLVANGFATF